MVFRLIPCAAEGRQAYSGTWGNVQQKNLAAEAATVKLSLRAAEAVQFIKKHFDPEVYGKPFMDQVNDWTKQHNLNVSQKRARKQKDATD